MSRRSFLTATPIYDLSLLGLVLDDPKGWRDGFDTKWPSKAVPGRIGHVVTSAAPAYSPRNQVLTGAIEADDVATLISRIDEIKWRVGHNVENGFMFSDDESRFFYARCTRFDVPKVPPALTQTAVRFLINLWQTDPRRYDISQTIVSGISTATDLPLGTAPTEAVISTASTSFTITYKDYNSTTVASMTITGASGTVTIDMADYTITDGGGNAADKMTAGGFFSFDPVDSNWPVNAWPTLEISSGTCTATYRKAWA